MESSPRTHRAVWVYMTLAVGPEHVDESVREIFARFFTAVRNSDELADAQVASLLRATRRSCVRHTERSTAALRCRETPRMLVDMVERRAPPAKVERLHAHMRGCRTCDELRAGFNAAEHLYATPPGRPHRSRRHADRQMAAAV